MLEKKEVTFNIEGKFITQLAREWMFCEGREFEKVMDLLLSCMGGTNQSEKTLRRLAEDVLLGRAELSGNTAEGTFCLTTYNADEQTDVPEQFNIFSRYVEAIRKKEKAEKEKEMYMEWYAVAMEYVPEYLKNEVRHRTDQPIESRYGSDMLAGFMERTMDEKEHSTEDYGWLEPDGTFHEVEWGVHQEWAQNYMDEKFPEEAMNGDINLQTKCNVGLIGAGDWLVERGWVLLHNPSQGIAFPTKNPMKRYTKAQKEFLYDYYMERGKEKEANAIYGDDL
nr:hypothetical protein [uncultured Blautia sp.]